MHLLVILLYLVQSIVGNVIPLHYNLSFDIQPKMYKGMSEIQIQPTRDIQHFNINSQDLDIASIELYYDDRILPGHYTKVDRGTIDIQFDEVLFENALYTVKFVYSGEYSKQMDGIYKSTYNNNDVFSTHFEATSARKAFPCFDRPDLKATFSVTITAPDVKTVLSNSDLHHKEGNVYVFNKTEKMSTYLLAFVVGNFDYVQTQSDTNIPIRVYTDVIDIESADYALHVAKEALNFFESYFDIKYPFPKLDLVAIPSFAMGAMENWGLVTFRKSSLLYDKQVDSTNTKLLVLETVCHEIAHMWFGNLVTMEWWNDLWLNEGFATWAAAMAVYNMPKKLVEFDVWTNFINEDLEYGLEYDALRATHPIAVDVKNPDEINQIFDHISYNKGASIIRMIEDYVGHEKFREGIQKYMNYFAYKNARSVDLFKFHKNAQMLTAMLNSWIKQEGFPLVTITEQGDTLKIAQSRFISGHPKTDTTVWTIPITLQFYGREPQTLILDRGCMYVKKLHTIYKLNIATTGVYRVSYPLTHVNRLYSLLTNDKEKLNILNDVYALAFGNYIDMKWTINFTVQNVKSTNYDILKAVYNHFHKLHSIYYDDTDTKKYIEGALMSVIGEELRKFNLYKKETSITGRLQKMLMLNFAILVKDARILEMLRKYYHKHKLNVDDIEPDYKYYVFTSVINEQYDEIMKIAHHSKVHSTQIAALRALGGVSDLKHLQQLLKSYDNFDRQDLSSYFAGLSKNHKHKTTIISFFMKEYRKIKLYINNDSILNSTMTYLLCGIPHKELLSKVETFLQNIANKGSEMTIDKIIEYNKNIQLMKQQNNEHN